MTLKCVVNLHLLCYICNPAKNIGKEMPANSELCPSFLYIIMSFLDIKFHRTWCYGIVLTYCLFLVQRISVLFLQLRIHNLMYMFIRSHFAIFPQLLFICWSFIPLNPSAAVDIALRICFELFSKYLILTTKMISGQKTCCQFYKCLSLTKDLTVVDSKI